MIHNPLARTVRALTVLAVLSTLTAPMIGCTGASREIVGGVGARGAKCPPQRRQVGDFCKTSLDNP